MKQGALSVCSNMNDGVWWSKWMHRLATVAPGPVSACVADVCALPLDSAKIRIQVAHGTGSAIPTTLGAMRVLVKEGGPAALFSGLKPSQLRQFTYGGMRMNIWRPIKDVVCVDPLNPSVAASIMSGALAGGIASAACAPTDVIKVRMQADSRAYKGVFHAVSSIVRTEGVPKLWRGATVTATRASVLAAAELGIYDLFKTRMMSNGLMQDGPFLHTSGGVIAGLSAILVTFPIDVAKSRLIRQGLNGEPVLYSGMIDCILQTFRERGLFGMYKGSAPAVGRQVGMNVVQWQVYEQLMRLLAGV